jgi:C1A family cysteine protease
MALPRKVYGLKPDPVDPRDLHFRTDYLKIGKLRQRFRAMLLPQSVDLREEKNPPIFDQGELGSCTANALSGILGHVTADQGDGVELFSRLFLYGNARRWVPEDEGATLRDLMKGLDKYGVPLESMWPYDVARWKDKPPQAVWDAAWHREAVDYYRIDTLDGMRLCLAGDRKPFIFGVLLYSNFAPGADGMIPMPGVNDRVSGGHAMACVGYDNRRQALLIRNSWGEDWGMGGHAWLPYAYTQDAGLWWDAWTVRSIPA